MVLWDVVRVCVASTLLLVPFLALLREQFTQPEFLPGYRFLLGYNPQRMKRRLLRREVSLPKHHSPSRSATSLPIDSMWHRRFDLEDKPVRNSSLAKLFPADP